MERNDRNEKEEGEEKKSKEMKELHQGGRAKDGSTKKLKGSLYETASCDLREK